LDVVRIGHGSTSQLTLGRSPDFGGWPPCGAVGGLTPCCRRVVGIGTTSTTRSQNPAGGLNLEYGDSAVFPCGQSRRSIRAATLPHWSTSTRGPSVVSLDRPQEKRANRSLQDVQMREPAPADRLRGFHRVGRRRKRRTPRSSHPSGTVPSGGKDPSVVDSVGDGPSLVRTRPTLPLTSIGSNASNIALSWSAHQAEGVLQEFEIQQGRIAWSEWEEPTSPLRGAERSAPGGAFR